VNSPRNSPLSKRKKNAKGLRFLLSDQPEKGSGGVGVGKKETKSNLIGWFWGEVEEENSLSNVGRGEAIKGAREKNCFVFP